MKGKRVLMKGYVSNPSFTKVADSAQTEHAFAYGARGAFGA